MKIAGLIPAGGLGTRLGELGLRTPKALLPFKGKTFLERCLDEFSSAGINEIYVSISSKKNVVSKFNTVLRDTNVHLVLETKACGNLGSLRELSDFEQVVVAFPDVDRFFPIRTLVDSHIMNKAGATIVVQKSHREGFQDVVLINRAGSVKGIIRSNPPKGQSLVFAPFAAIRMSVVKPLFNRRYLDLSKDLIPWLLRNHHLVTTITCDYLIQDLGRLEDYTQAVKKWTSQ